MKTELNYIPPVTSKAAGVCSVSAAISLSTSVSAAAGTAAASDDDDDEAAEEATKVTPAA